MAKKVFSGNGGNIAETPHTAITMGVSTMMSAKKIYLIGWGILIGNYLIQHHSLLLLQLLWGEFWAECKLYEQSYCPGEILFEDGRMDNNLLLRGKRIELPSKFFDIGIDARCRFVLCPFEDHVLGKMGNTAECLVLAAGTATDGQGAICHRRGTFLEKELQTLEIYLTHRRNSLE